MNQSSNWIMLFGLFIAPFLIINYKKPLYGLAAALIGLSTEDLFYWFWAKTLPASWSIYYPVLHHIPLDDIFGIFLALLLFSQ